MTWLTWRLHGGKVRLVGLVTALAVAGVVTGRALLASQPRVIQVTGGLPIEAVTLGTIVAPGLLGMFLGAPLVATEIERGTHRLAWAQAVSRRRWLVLQVALLLGVGTAAMAVAGAANSWGLQPLFDHRTSIPTQADGPFQPVFFDVIAIVPAAYGAFAVALGVALGAFTRRTLVAMFLVVVLFTTVRVAIGAGLRPSFEPPVRVLTPLGSGPVEVPVLAGAYTVGGHLVDPAGHPASDCPGDCPGYQLETDYQPPDRFWAFQLIEAGIYAALTALLLGLTFWRVVRRPA